MTLKLGDFLNSINFTKNNVFVGNEFADKDYVPFVINKSLSYFRDTIGVANEMNTMHGLPKRMQYEFALHAVRPRKRFSKWIRPEHSADVAIVAEFYNCTTKKAEQLVTLLNEQQLQHIKQLMDTGGGNQGGKR